MSFSRYPTYRTTCLKHLQELPAHWAVMPLKRVVGMRSGETIAPEMIDEVGPYAVFGGNGIRGFTTDFTHDGEYVLVGRQGALCGNVNYARGRFWASEHAIVVTPYEKTDIAWLGECLRVMNLNQYSVSAAQPGLSVDVISRLAIGVPPRAEQIAIGGFLKREIGKIDALVAEQRRLIGLLKEKRQALISHAVTMGLKADAPMKPSNVEWLGDVPAHWRVLTIKRLSTVKRGASPRPIDDPKYFDEEGHFAWVRIVDVTASDGLLYETEQRLSDLGSALSVKLSPGQLFLSIAGSVGKPCVTRVNACIHDGFVYFPQLTPENAAFLYYVFDAGSCFGGLGKLGTQLNLNTHTVGAIPIAQPPPSELAEITRYVDVESARLAALVSEVQTAIELLEERRAALISAAVTGQIDVRGLATAEVA